MSRKYNKFDRATIHAICDTIASTDFPGLSERELRAALECCGGINFFVTEGNKRDSLKKILSEKQEKDDAGNIIIRFITEAMNIQLYTTPDQEKRWKELQSNINRPLSIIGLGVNDKGKLAKLNKEARSLDEVAALSSSLRRKLETRNCHNCLFKYCDEEIINESLFHAISEAAKSISDRICEITELTGDGEILLNEAFGSKEKEPLIYINEYKSKSEISEQLGFKNLLKGIHGHFRNPRAHSPRLNSNEDIEEFLDAFSTFSYVHRRLDRAHTKKE